MRIKIIVKTNSNKNKVVSYDENYMAYRIETKEKPQNNKANAKIEKILSRYFNKEAKIISGFKTNKKLVSLE